MNKVLFSSDKENWETPQWLFKELDQEFKFTIDVCADITNNKCKRFYTEIDNALIQDWNNEIVWCNPPYGRKIRRMGKKSIRKPSDSCDVVTSQD